MSRTNHNKAKHSNFRCDKCGEKMLKIHGECRMNYKCYGEVVAKNVHYHGCPNCDGKMFGPDACKKIEKALNHMIREKLLQQPIGDFITSDETARILKMKPQQLASKRVKVWLMSLKIGKNTLYLKRSVNRYRRHKNSAGHNDGRIVLKDLK